MTTGRFFLVDALTGKNRGFSLGIHRTAADAILRENPDG